MSFRSIDVDALDEDILLPDELFAFSNGIEIDPETALNNVKSKEVEVRNLLTRGDTSNALIKAIENPPYGLFTIEAKDLNTQIVMEVLNSTKATVEFVKSLATEQQDILMKYIYRGMASPDLYNSAVLLNWHEKLTEVAGVGCIVRVITDRKAV
ncbi:arp2/3 complex subunit [Rhizophagus irregularis]|uniref:Actin-related protein 2/3 complex subunit 5 n=4 Tax=Rhizophagus irregularis TaxID=588596 RepID=A0A2I1G773_9GLOM|nr:arp2/3 complex subunit [Rhizophagus irregularis DAOM 181602=DAOM 197198]EXX69506.1 Arc15p [Rhizophagus irregularis DAOM 197198w]PKC05736.1 arp2/3 complex subunit [Rhizophagus irregularis]PKC73938.1 arp2/3 complex subunit [Rhizophagus irregularis]PKY23856.1 arp2/3 complex subunit [Rhizophagus irregularis]PKY42450.1 arp2/3 complex subunit [Rhizophagus irregularis]|eukprot:XP_025179328.1 arp2/3 complex subunit [Rhizophagus irregularis DAOM 181602=DAOM 197198]